MEKHLLQKELLDSFQKWREATDRDKAMEYYNKCKIISKKLQN